MNKVKRCLISSLFILISFAGHTQSIIEDFYSGNDIKINEAIAIYEKAKNAINFEDLTEDSILEYLYASTILSTLYSSGLMPKYEELVNSLDDEIKKLINHFPQSLSSYDICMEYANFLYSQFSWKTNTGDIIMKLPILYRKASSLNKNNTDPLAKLSIWYISASNYTTSNWNGFIKLQEANISKLNDVDKFNGYLWYSIFYAKNYNSEKSIFYLDQAKSIFPNSILTMIIEENYKKGIMGW
ncbi:hypothetical protein [Treponema brennaborense]|uniref:Lipoprotein n=1 Tax=Treponema brennaborense (strain DSM 12168 / CIP 105900 / DD5/3) TaxID=906968 RepID=F4LJN6_TREBD|nr:hypothetical protein [Treponema brennaborense]AEE17416.1 hypothetical protein Trebr_2001 [Treponema brennaborense DSM 12168]